MHPTALMNCKKFFDTYESAFSKVPKMKVVEIGSQDINGNLKQVTPTHFEHIGVDYQEARGVDIVLEDPYVLPFKNESVDIVLTSSCFEHSEMFWLVYLEVMRILKPYGIFYLNTPSSGGFHRFPVDCWRFYPDSAKALIAWGKRNKYNSAVLESFTQMGGGWQDYVAIFLKDEKYAKEFGQRILDTKTDYENGQLYGIEQVFHYNPICQNEKRLIDVAQIVNQP